MGWGGGLLGNCPLNKELQNKTQHAGVGALEQVTGAGVRLLGGGLFCVLWEG